MARKRMARKCRAAMVSGVFATGLMVALPSSAQLSTSTIRGHVVLGTAPARAGASVVATNVATGYAARTVTRDDGSYALTGLPPGSYRIEVSGSGFDQRTQELTVAVGQTAELDVTVSATAARIETIVVAGNRLLETKTSEVATHVTPRQMERLPQVTRNFL